MTSIRNGIFMGWMVFAAACAVPSEGDDDGGGGGGGGGDGSGWTAMPLVDDVSDPNEKVYHQGNDLVSGIYFETPDKGFVVSQGAGETFSKGGAVFTATGDAVTGVAFSGNETGLRLLGTINWIGLEPSPSGYIAMAYATDVVQSTDAGSSFQIEHNSSSDRFGIEPVLAYRVTATGTTMVRKTGVVTVSAGAPGPDTIYEDVWAPNASAPIPNPVPADMCQGGPLGTGAPTTRYSVHVSADRDFIAYTSNPDHSPEICISTDGGRSFYPRTLDVPESAVDFPATGVVFTSNQHGITWFAQPTADGGNYVKRTTDGGTTWNAVALPAEIANRSLELPAAFFAPDGQHGWLAGYDYDDSAALLLATTDGGATWSVVPGVAAAVEAAGGDKLYTGFALDADHVWVGGARGLLLHN